MQHCVAWFTTSPTEYVTIEIISGKTSGVIAEKSCGKMGSSKLQLVVEYWNGSLGSDKEKVDWRKKYTKRWRSIESIIDHSKHLFKDWNYDVLGKNCQDFAEKLIDYATK